MKPPFGSRCLALLPVLLMALVSWRAAAETKAVVVAATENLYARPDETGPVDSQAILGERVVVLESAVGFAKVRTPDGNAAWIPERSLRRGDAPPAEGTKVARVTSNFAHVYGSPSFTAAKPLLSAPVGARTIFLEDEEKSGFSWVRVALPDGRIGFVARPDVAVLPFEEESPSSFPF